MFQVLAGKALRLIARLQSDERGQTSTEYSGVLVIAVALAFAVGAFVLIPLINDIIGKIQAFILTVYD